MPQRAEQIASALTDLFAGAVAQHRALALEKDSASWCSGERHGVQCARLDAAAIRALEPAVSSDHTVAMYMTKQGAVTPLEQMPGALSAFHRQSVRSTKKMAFIAARSGTRGL
jgi:hypothetical protein